jgi:hypothetical protein
MQWNFDEGVLVMVHCIWKGVCPVKLKVGFVMKWRRGTAFPRATFRED